MHWKINYVSKDTWKYLPDTWKTFPRFPEHPVSKVTRNKKIEILEILNTRNTKESRRNLQLPQDLNFKFTEKYEL